MPERPKAPEFMEETDVVELLIRQHMMIRQLFDEVEETPASDRAEAFQRLVRLLAVHETAEEEIVHPYARRKIEDGDNVVRDRLREEREAKELLSVMDKAGVADQNFSTNLAKLRAAVLAHANSEERYEFARLREATTEAERRAMAAGVKAAEALAPTHPHPGVESMKKNLLMGPPTALMDRTRDVIRKAMRKS
ncbi:hemerythrin [Microtetraspora sp. NBRC 13810]|uniref:hemerythrin domain-containing protein n=1 Tax=Microtetraspora sp. NBRC 13810 TaxID=3030990 RepID=UPI0024A2F22A|nr:hemerythrin domain-containing protein [Microtetraspora sp. NBRC 13810]GLW07652.1 hemerythrin [Microtetraspora sp. NBRC 13810]